MPAQEHAWERATARVPPDGRPPDGSLVYSMDGEPIGITGDRAPTKAEQRRLDRATAAWRAEQERLSARVTPHTPFERLYETRKHIASHFYHFPDSVLDDKLLEAYDQEERRLLRMGAQRMGREMADIPLIYWHALLRESALSGASDVFLHRPAEPEDTAWESCLWLFELPTPGFFQDRPEQRLKTLVGINADYWVVGVLGIRMPHRRDTATYWPIACDAAAVATPRGEAIQQTSSRIYVPYFADVEVGKRIDLNACPYVAMQRFMHEKLVAVPRATVPRGDRRRAAKAGKPAPDIRVVTLRKAETRKGAGADADATAPIDWSCHWTVRGHWRRDPTKRAGAPIYVHAYVKGDTNKPFKPPKETLYDVRR